MVGFLLPSFGRVFFECRGRFFVTKLLDINRSNVGGNPMFRAHDISTQVPYDLNTCGKFSSKKMNASNARGGVQLVTGLPPSASYTLQQGGDRSPDVVDAYSFHSIIN